MCGLVGLISKKYNTAELTARVRKMMAAILHRGPDGDGIYVSEQNGLVLGHQRLAIIDPEHGAQPLSTVDGRYTVIFNGAIYNYLEIRRELISRGHPIHTYSDTEVIPYAYAEWGVECVQKFRGMFAFALFDQAKNTLFCARDRLGIKPFYYYHQDDTFIFGSEIKAVLASDLVTARPDNSSLQDFITFQFCLENRTLFKDIHKLEAGHYLLINLNEPHLHVQTKQYWDIDFTLNTIVDEKYYVDNLVTLLEDSIRMHLRSDVPLGAHLSGGLDSSTVVCLAAKMLTGLSFKTFTGAFREGIQFDETEHAKCVAAAAGTEYHEIYVPGAELPTILPKLIYHMDEPLAGPGLIPQYYVSKLAAQHVKVVLGGQGGDELYMGYARYFVAYLEKCLAAAIWPGQTHVNEPASLQALIPNLPLLNEYKPMLTHFFKEGMFQSEDQRYFRLVDRAADTQPLYNPDIFSVYSSFSSFQKVFNKPGDTSFINKMSYFDLKASLPALLHVEDRTSMAVSLESRVPLLDHKLVEFIASIPPQIKFANGKTKHIFRESVKHLLPNQILNRQDKKGFPVPLNQWFAGSAREFVSDILFSDRAKQRGLYDIASLQKEFSKQQQFSRVFWGVLGLELWFRTFIDKAAS